jgi:mRNA interferase MazF
VRRGEVWWVDLRPRSGSEQRGKRPAIVVSHDALNGVEAWRSIVVVPITTSRRQASRHLTTVPLKAGDGGLQRDSVALCHQVTTLDRGKFVERAGELDGDTRRAVDEGLAVALDLAP